MLYLIDAIYQVSKSYWHFYGDDGCGRRPWVCEVTTTTIGTCSCCLYLAVIKQIDDLV